MQRLGDLMFKIEHNFTCEQLSYMLAVSCPGCGVDAVCGKDEIWSPMKPKGRLLLSDADLQYLTNVFVLNNLLYV